MKINNAIMIFIEPTPYIQGFVSACRAIFQGRIDVYYVRTDVSQSWSSVIDPGFETVLPQPRLAALRVVAGAIWRAQRSDIVHLAGWGDMTLASAMILARLRGAPVFVESDTWRRRQSRGRKGNSQALLFKALLQLPSHFLPGGTRQARLLESYGVPTNRMTVAGMTVDVSAMQSYARKYGREARSARRKELKLEPMRWCSCSLAGSSHTKGSIA